jgi:hypothetical protein
VQPQFLLTTESLNFVPTIPYVRSFRAFAIHLRHRKYLADKVLATDRQQLIVHIMLLKRSSKLIRKRINAFPRDNHRTFG